MDKKKIYQIALKKKYIYIYIYICQGLLLSLLEGNLVSDIRQEDWSLLLRVCIGTPGVLPSQD